MPFTVTVQPGQISATFPIKTTAVASNMSDTVYATLNGKTVNYGLGVNAPKFINLTFTGSSALVGGTSKTITANLNGPAPFGGFTVTLSSSNSAIGSVPQTVTIPQGATSVTFSMSTTAVTSATTVTITGVNGASSSQTFHVTT